MELMIRNWLPGGTLPHSVGVRVFSEFPKSLINADWVRKNIRRCWGYGGFNIIDELYKNKAEDRNPNIFAFGIEEDIDRILEEIAFVQDE